MHRMTIKHHLEMSKHMILFFINTLSWAVVFLSAAEVEVDLKIDKSNWVDPTDPLAKSSSILNSAADMLANNNCGDDNALQKCLLEYEKLRIEFSELRKLRTNSVDMLMKHVLRQFLSKLNVNLNHSESVFKKAQVVLSRDDLSLMKRYLASEKAVEEFGLREDLRTVLENFIVETDLRSDNSFFTFLHRLLPYLLVLNVILLLPAFLVFLQASVSTRKLVVFILLSTFCWSCYATYMRKYQEILAERFLRTDVKMRAGGKHPCSPQGLISEAFDVMLSYVRIKDKSECLKAYEDELIAPLWQVDPLQVIAEVLSNFFFGGLPASGTHLNQFFNNFFINTPLHLALVKVLFAFVMPLGVAYIIYLYAISRSASAPSAMRELDNAQRARRHRRRIEERTTPTALKPNRIQETNAGEAEALTTGTESESEASQE